MWRNGRLPFPHSRILLLYCRHYGYIHVPKKKPPHILGPSKLWRKCFVVHPLTEISDPLTKYQWLTKSVLIEGLPQSVTSQVLPSESIVNDFKERAFEVCAYQIHKSHRGRGMYNHDTVSGVLQSILASVWPLASDFRHLRSSHMTFKPNIESYWRRNGENFITRTQPLYVLHTNMGLGLFCEVDFVGEGLPPVQYSPLHLNLFKHSFDQILPFGGSRKFSPFTLAHTVFVVDRKNHTSELIHTHGLIQLFSQSTAAAVQNGFKIDYNLPYPLVTQGIITDGKKFTFVCFQLNTLDLRRESDENRCNVFWAGPTLDLFDKVVHSEGLIGFNESCAELIFKFLLHRPIRKRLRQWGGRGRALPRYKLETDGQELSPITQINSNC